MTSYQCNKYEQITPSYRLSVKQFIGVTKTSLTHDTCVAEYFLKEIQKDHPNIKQLFRKTDNAGCYSGNSVAEIEFSICRQNGFTLLWHDYNEPQKSKDQADRERAVAKKYMNGYLNSWHDIVTAEDIKKGILYLGGPADTKVSVIEINKNDCHIVHSKIPNI